MIACAEGYVLTFLGLTGACIGSFLNVVVYRLPRECMSIAHPRSRCTACAELIAWFDNIPLLSWLLLRGRCRHCKARISPRYILVEAITAAWFVLSAVFLLGGGQSADLLDAPGTVWLAWLAQAIIFSVLLALTLIDIDHRILPDELTIGGMVLGPALAFMAPGFQHARSFVRTLVDLDLGPRVLALADGLVGMAAGAGVLWLVGWIGARAFRREAMGFGDVKMMGAMGAVLGMWVFLALVVASFVGAIVGVIGMCLGQGRQIPFGPFLAAGMLVVMFAGPQLLELWLGMARAH